MKNIVRQTLVLFKLLTIIFVLRKKIKEETVLIHSITILNQDMILIMSSIKLINTEKYVNVKWTWVDIPKYLTILNVKNGMPLGKTFEMINE